MLRVFNRYHPRQIAIYVKRFFRGNLSIKGIGDFEFANGKLLPPSSKNLQAFAIVKEVNAEIKRLMQLAVAWSLKFYYVLMHFNIAH